MTVHSLTYTQTAEGVETHAHCAGLEGDACRLVCEDFECEGWVIERDDDGPFHMTTAYDDVDGESEVRQNREFQTVLATEFPGGEAGYADAAGRPVRFTVHAAPPCSYAPEPGDSR